MIRNFLKIAIRNLLKHKFFSFLNISGLAIGLASFILMFLWIKDEVNYDKSFPNFHRIYRITEQQFISSATQHLATTSGPLAEAIRIEVPQVEEVTRLFFKNKMLLSYNEKRFHEDKLLYADPNFLDVFKFKMIHGDLNSALSAPNSIVLPASVAYKYFGLENPMGKIIRVNNKVDMTVTGVIEDPSNLSHFHFNSIASMSTLGAPAWMAKWVRSIYTYVLLKENASVTEASKKLPFVVKKYMGPEYLKIIKYHLQPITNIHLHSDLVAEIESNGDISTVKTFLVIAISILILACFNFVNLSLGQSLKRLKEVGLRKAFGALKKQLVFQFLLEAYLISIVSFFLAVFISVFSIPFINHFFELQINLFQLTVPSVGIGFLCLIIIFAFIAGIVPALKLANYDPIGAVSNKLKREGTGLRKALAIIQFTISISLCILSLVVFQQFNFLRSKNLGFEKELLVSIKGIDLTTFKGKAELLKQEFLNLPQVKHAASMLNEIGEELDVSEVRNVNGSSDENLIFSTSFVDHHFLQTLQIPLVAGRNFNYNSSDTINAFLINETAVKKLGFKSTEEAIEKNLLLLSDGSTQKIIGVMKDYHFASLHEEIQPLLLLYNPKYLNKMMVKINSTDVSKALTSLEEQWRKNIPDFPFAFQFADEGLRQLYSKEKTIGQIVALFTGIAILIACLGLFGLATYSVGNRLKEIGVRKVLGASLQSLILLLSGQFLYLVLLSFVIASPISLMLVNEWLNGFAYRIDLEWSVFLFSGIFFTTIAFSTISVLIVKACLLNPVDILKNE